MTEYRASLLSCCGDLPLCLYGCCCPFILNSDNLAKVRNEYWTVCHLIYPVSPYWTRQFVKENRKMPHKPTEDCLVTFCCLPCAVIQDAKEIRGY